MIALALLLLQSAPSDEAVPLATIRQVERGMTAAIALEDPDSPGEWPYESARRDQGAIPIGYRVGGTGAMVTALATLPAPDAERRAALERGLAFLADAMEEPGMSENVQPGIDARLWAFVTSLRGMLAARSAGMIAPFGADSLDRVIAELVRRLGVLEIPRSGGWSYSRPSGRLMPAPAYSYVTADVLQVLFEARRQGFDVDADMVERALDVLEAQREPTGAFAYRGLAGTESPTSLPSSAGRMVLCETALYQAGRSDVLHVRAAIDAFFSHWERLEERRGRADLHLPPYGIAPYYFLYAHGHVGRAIELLPPHDRPEYRARLAERLHSVRNEDEGTWNDRVYRRSAAYGTCAASLALMAPMLEPLARWRRPPVEDEQD